MHTYTHISTPCPHRRVYIYLSLFLSVSAVDSLQTPQGIQPSPSRSLLSLSTLPLCLSLFSPGLGLVHTFPRKPQETNSIFADFH